MNWNKTKNILPPEQTVVLGWDKRRKFTICYWIDRKDCKRGEYWNVNGSSGGIGTDYYIKPPAFWQYLPEKPT